MGKSKRVQRSHPNSCPIGKRPSIQRDEPTKSSSQLKTFQRDCIHQYERNTNSHYESGMDYYPTPIPLYNTRYALHLTCGFTSLVQAYSVDFYEAKMIHFYCYCYEILKLENGRWTLEDVLLDAINTLAFSASIQYQLGKRYNFIDTRPKIDRDRTLNLFPCIPHNPGMSQLRLVLIKTMYISYEDMVFMEYRFIRSLTVLYDYLTWVGIHGATQYLLCCIHRRPWKTVALLSCKEYPLPAPEFKLKAWLHKDDALIPIIKETK